MAQIDKGATPDPGTASASLLVVEDDPQISDLYQLILQKAGYAVSLAGDGREALRLYQQALEARQPYDLVMMDLQLPVMDGLTCLHRLSRLDQTVRVLITTGSPGGDFGEAAGHVAGVVLKPVGIKTLLGEIHSALGWRQSPA
jgi:DNA-binding response OmpR family regulator